MSEEPPDLSLLLDLPASTLQEIADELRGGSLRHGISAGLLRPFAGPLAGEIARVFAAMTVRGCPGAVLADFCGALHSAKLRMERAENDVYVTLSGPEVPGIPVVDTGTVVRALFEEARQEVLVTSYVFSHARELLAPLAGRMSADPAFRVRFILDLTHQRRTQDEPLPVVANRFRRQFLGQHWTGRTEPEFWHDPRSFHETDPSKRGVMHSKVVIIDSSAALITSANFTAAAHSRNVEAGTLIRHPRHVRTVRNYFEGLILKNHLVPLR